MNNGE